MEEINILKWLTSETGIGLALFVALAAWVIIRQQKMIDSLQSRLVDRSEKSIQTQLDTAVGLSAMTSGLERIEGVLGVLARQRK